MLVVIKLVPTFSAISKPQILVLIFVSILLYLYIVWFGRRAGERATRDVWISSCYGFEPFDASKS